MTLMANLKLSINFWLIPLFFKGSFIFMALYNELYCLLIIKRNNIYKICKIYIAPFV